MSCIHRDQDLLLLAHGALPPLRRAFAESHLRRCRHCRERKEHLGMVSRQLAGAIRGQDLPAWIPPDTPAPAPRAQNLRLRRALALSLALLLATASVALAVWRVRAYLSSCNVSSTVSPAPVSEEPQSCPVTYPSVWAVQMRAGKTPANPGKNL